MESYTWTYAELSEDQYKQVNDQLAKKDTLDILKWAYGTFGDDLVYACSFGAEGMVLIDLISKIRKDANIIFLDTHLHFHETYQLIERVKEKYPTLNIQMLEPELTLQQQAEQHGPELWKRKPDICCHMRKIQPLETALSKAQAWVSGLRREQSPTRAQTQFVNPDHRFQSIKICPLIHWSWDDIWNYIRIFNLEYNELHDQNYPSIGCEMCTLPVQSGEDSREGRWANAGKTECGLHTSIT
jgi:phosphoadenosine phosphosulfate reductase